MSSGCLWFYLRVYCVCRVCGHLLRVPLRCVVRCELFVCLVCTIWRASGVAVSRRVHIYITSSASSAAQQQQTITATASRDSSDISYSLTSSFDVSSPDSSSASSSSSSFSRSHPTSLPHPHSLPAHLYWLPSLPPLCQPLSCVSHQQPTASITSHIVLSLYMYSARTAVHTCLA